jgi:hypothetical protein
MVWTLKLSFDVHIWHFLVWRLFGLLFKKLGDLYDNDLRLIIDISFCENFLYSTFNQSACTSLLIRLSITFLF